VPADHQRHAREGMPAVEQRKLDPGAGELYRQLVSAAR
jgi:hypothetical protein